MHPLGFFFFCMCIFFKCLFNINYGIEYFIRQTHTSCCKFLSLRIKLISLVLFKRDGNQQTMFELVYLKNLYLYKYDILTII